MDYENKEQPKAIEKLRQIYRLVVMHDETFEEVGSYRLNLMSLLLTIGAAILCTVVLTVLLFSYTPLKKLMPGYKTALEHKQVYLLHQQIEEMEQQLASQKLYTDNFRKILVGQVETEDSINTYIVETPDTILDVERIEEDEALRQELAMDKLAAEDRIAGVNVAPRILSLDQMHFFPPVDGTISEGYKPDQKHYGVDVMAPKNTPIKSIMDGFVILSNQTLETGNTIAIQHSNNLISFYKHNSILLKKTGDYVRSGEAVAIIGNSGTLSSGPHLHFELWHNGRTLNPADYVQFSSIKE